MITNRLPKRLIQLITYILIIAFLGQNFSWADGPATPLLSLRKETEGLVLMPDNKGILSEFTESFANVPDPCKAWTTFNSRHPSFVESIERLTADEKALLKEFVIAHRDNLPGCALLLFSNLLGDKPLIEQEIAIRGLETRMLAEDYPDRLIEEYKEAVREWERSLKASSAQDKRKNFKILINAYNDSPRLNSLLESIYEELVAFEYGKGIEICVIEHSDKPEECDLNRKYVELWNTELQNKGRTDWMFRYVSLEEQYGLVKEINRNTGVNIETEFLYCSRAAQSPSDLAGRGFASAVNMALLWAQTKIDPEDKDSLVMFFDQDVEIGALINGDNGIRKRKITHTFHYISRAFDDMEVNMLACRLNGDPANSLDGLIGGHNERGAFHSFRHFLQRAIEAEDIDSMCDFWEYFYAMEDDPERLSYRDMMQRMLKELENIKGGKYTAFKVLHNKRGRKPVTESGRSDTAPFGTGFVIRPDIAGKVPLFEVIRGSDIYYQIFLKYFVENKICTINIPVIHNKNPELNKPLAGDLHRLFSSNIGGNSTHLWVNRKIANGKGRVEGLFTHPDMIRLEAGADTEFVEAFIKAFKSDLRKYLLEAEKIYELLKNPALDKFGIDLGQAKAFFSEFIRAAREVLNIDEGEYCSNTAFDTMAQMQEWPEKIQLWQELMGKIDEGFSEEQAVADKEEPLSSLWIPPIFTGETMGALVFVSILTWQNNPHLIYIKDIWNYLMLRIWDIRRRLGLVKAAQPEEPEVVESGPSFEEPEVAEEVPSVEAVDVVLDTNSTPSRKLRNLRNRMRRLLDREVINPELLETIVREMEVLLARYEHLHLTNQPLYQEFEELRQTVEALLKKAAEPESEPELEETPLPVEKPPSPEPESRPRRRRRRRNVWAELMPGPERDMGMYLEGRFRPAIVENMVEEGMRYIKRGVLREGAGAVQLAEYLAILRKNNFTGQRQKPVLLIYHEGALFRIRDRDGNIVGVIPNLIVLKRGSTEEGGMGFMHMKKHFPEFDGMSVEQILEWLARTIKDGLVRKYMIQKEKKGLVGNKEYSLYRDDTGQAYRAIVSDDDYVVTFYTEYFKDFGLSELLDVRPEEALLLIKRLSDRVRVEIYDLLPNPAEIGDLVRGYRKAGRTIQAIRRRIYYYPGTAKRDPFIGIWNHSRMEMVLMDFMGNVFDAVNSKSLKGYHRTEITSIVHRADMYYLEKNESGERQMISKGSGAPNIAVATSGMYTQEQHDKTNQKIKNDMENEEYISCKLETDMRIEIGENIEINGNELAERMREVITALDPETQEALQEVSLFLVQPDDPEHPYCLRTETIDGRLEYQVAHAGSNRGRGCFIYLTIPAFMDFPASLLNKIIVREINFAKERLACRKQGLEIPDDIDGYTSEVAEILDRIKQFEMLASDDKKEQFYRFCERLSEMMKEIYPGVELPGAETLWEIIHNGRLPSDWPGLVSAMRKDGVIDDEDFEVVTKVGKAVEQANQDAKLTVSEMAMLTETISIKYLLESRGLRDEFEEKLRNRLYVLGYGSKAGRIIALLAGLKKKGRFNRRSHFDFVKRLEKLLGRGDIFKEIGISRNVSSSDIMGNGDDSVTRYWADIFELNGKQWEVLELLRDKNPSGIIVQDIRGFGSGVGNWLEGIRRCGVNMSGVRMAYIIDNEVNESDRQKLIAEKPDNVILVYSLEEIRKQSDNIVYLAVEKKLNDHIGTGIKLVEKGHAGPIIELSLCLLMLATDNTRGAYKEFLNKMASLDLISREQVGELSDPYYIKLPDVRAEVLKMWKDLEQGTSFLDFWA